MKFSICIPNYNYAHYLDVTLKSVFDQEYGNFEILVSDNASTDKSVEVINSFQDPRVKVHVNRCNIGFAGNLDQAAKMATGDRLILLSSDDLIGPEALSTYHRFLQLLDDGGEQSIISSSEYQIDSQGAVTAHLKLPGPPFLLPTDRATELEAKMGVPVYRVPAGELLRRCVLGMQNPFHFATTNYPRSLYESVGGYGGGRTFNPDKWFHWRLLSQAKHAYFIDKPLFSYRWHATNQLAQEKKSGVLKFLVDEYLNVIEMPEAVLKSIGVTREDVEKAYIECDIGRHGWAVLAKDNAYEARRIVNFGRGVFPQHASSNRKVQLLRLAIPFGPLAHIAARRMYRSYSKKHPRNASLSFSDTARPAAPASATA